jgi:hypothetical protein
VELYKPKVAIEDPKAQYALAREFIPGESPASSAYLRRGSVAYAAASVPTATTEVGRPARIGQRGKRDPMTQLHAIANPANTTNASAWTP